MRNIIDIFAALRKKKLIDCNSNTHHTLTLDNVRLNFNHLGDIKSAIIKDNKVAAKGVTVSKNKIKIKIENGLYYCLTQNINSDNVLK